MSASQTALRYLPVDAAGQRYGILMDEIEAVFRVDVSTLGETPPGELADSSAPPIPIIDLAYLLGGVSHSGERLHTIVVRGTAGVYALLVDMVYPIRTAPATDQLNVPVLVGAACQLYRCMVRDGEMLLLVLSAARLPFEVKNGNQ